MSWRLPDAIGQPLHLLLPRPQMMWMILTNIFHNKLSIALTGVFVVLLALTACTAIPGFPATSLAQAPATTVSLSTTLTPAPSAATLTPSAEIVCPSGNCAYTCLSKIKSFLNAPGQPLSPPKSIYPRATRSHEIVTLVTYTVEADRITSPELANNLASDLIPYQADTQAHQKIWDYFSKIIPSERRSEIKSFVIATDGVGGVLASLGFSTSALSDWQLTVDIVDAVDPTDMTYTLIHEFGHLLTLNKSQVTADIQLLDHPNDQQVNATESAACPQYLSSEGCSQPKSYINLFYQKFWTDLYKSWTAINAEKDPLTYNKLLDQFYLAHQDQFVTPYSVTSPEEDLAETWAHFIFEAKPAGRSISQQKILFFYDYPDLEQLRGQIVNAICLYAAGK